MIVGKIISIFDISIDVILSDTNVGIGDILGIPDNEDYKFEVVEITTSIAKCLALASTRGLKKGSEVIKVSSGLEVEYSDAILGEYLILMVILLISRHLRVLKLGL